MSNLRYDAVAKSIVKRCQAEPKAVNWHYSGKIKVEDKTFQIVRIVTIDIHRDFVNNFTDEIMMTCILEPISYYKYILPNSDILEIHLTKKQMAENSSLFVRNGIVEKFKYKAVLHNPPTKGLGAGPAGQNEVINSAQSVIYATFQLIDQDCLELKLSTWSGFLQMSEPAQILQMILAKMGKNHNLKGVHMPQKWDVKEKRQMIIPRGTSVKDVTQYIQQEYGVFNHGIGNYIFLEKSMKGKFWFCYPLFDNNRYENEYYKLTICIAPKKFEASDVPRTYVINNGDITIYTVQDTPLIQNKTSEQINEGTGIQVLNSHENRSIVVNTAGYNKEVIDGKAGVSTFNVVKRRDELANYLPVYEDINNMAKLISSVVGNNGTYIDIEWRWANPDLLQPGMPVKITYLDGEKIRYLYGTLHEYHAISVIAQKTASDSIFNCTVAMKIYVTPKPDVKV